MKKIILLIRYKIELILKILYSERFLHFFAVGSSGVLINLLLTFIFTEFIFGRERYFLAYLIGLFVNLIYNFTFHTIITFKTKNYHLKRFSGFIVYNLIMSGIQAIIIKIIVNFIGVDFYLFVIIFVIGTFFIINFFVSKIFIFK